MLYFWYVGESDVLTLSELETKHDPEVQGELEVLPGIPHYSMIQIIELPAGDFYVDDDNKNELHYQNLQKDFGRSVVNVLQNKHEILSWQDQ